jgi:O-antigen ligase
MMGIVIICVAAICLVVFDVGGMGKFVEGRVSETLHEGTTEASAHRIGVVWPLWLDAFWKHPIIGIGLGGGFSILERSSHNDMLSLLGERGILGFSLYMVFQIVIIVETLRNSEVSYKLISIWILLFLLGSGMFTESLALKSYGLGIGLVEALNNIGGEINYQKS